MLNLKYFSNVSKLMYQKMFIQKKIYLLFFVLFSNRITVIDLSSRVETITVRKLSVYTTQWLSIFKQVKTLLTEAYSISRLD